MNANDEQLDFPILYASGRDGWCTSNLENQKDNLHEMLDLIVNYVAAPNVDVNQPFAMLATLLDADKYLGRCLIGRVEQGSAKVNDNVKAINLSGEKVELAD